MATKHRNMYKKWHEDWIASDWHVKKKPSAFLCEGQVQTDCYTVTHKTHNKQWAKVRLGQEWQHERIWDDV